MNAISTKRVQAALGQVEGFPFERFATDFWSALRGEVYVPTGGTKDGGADGFESTVYEKTGGRVYIQVSIRLDAEVKIRETVERLKEVGRHPTSVTYICSRPIKSADQIEDRLTEELDVTIRIRDANFITAHVNDNPRTQAAFNQHLHYLTEALDRLGSSNVVAPSVHIKDPSVFVFLTNEVEHRRGDQSLVSAVIDSLVLWSLEGTDPDRDILMSQEDILDRIVEVLPSVESLVAPRLKKRLDALVSHRGATGRTVRTYKARKQYCLPFATREALVAENNEDEALRSAVEASVEQRLVSQERPGIGSATLDKAVKVVLRALQRTFEKQGVSFIASLNNETGSEIVVVTDSVSAALDELGVNGKSRALVGAAVLDCLRGVLYESTQEERDYLHKLSRTYALLFTLNAEPKIVNYFQQMAGDFYLYVGSDQLIRALSEHYLSPADRVVGNTLRMAAAAGAHLVLTEPALDEVLYNLRTSDYEFTNTFARVMDYVNYEMARNSPKILVRAFLYARLGSGSNKPKSWQGFVNQFCDYGDLHRSSARDSIRRYLIGEFSMDYRTTEDLSELVNVDEHSDLKAELQEDKKKEVLAHNDALLALSVYGHRRRRRETSNISEFGYQTWWLTAESKILEHTAELIEKNDGAGYIMRPEFLLNFLTLAPAAASARQSFSNIFPSLLGVTLSRRMNDGPFKNILKKVEVATELSESRRGAAIARLSDQLKSDLEKQYLSTDSATGQDLTGLDALMQARYGDA